MENHNGFVVSSRQVAEDFGKDHKNVIQSIENLIEQLKDNTAENSALFIKTSYVASNGKTNPAYDLTRDGFSLLIMGFTGTNAIQWKLKYIDTFNKMETVVTNMAENRDSYMIADPIECAQAS
jgi:Rha family phage regulatory protein